MLAKCSASMFWSHGENGEQSLILDILIWPLVVISQTKYHVTLFKKIVIIHDYTVILYIYLFIFYFWTQNEAALK